MEAIIHVVLETEKVAFTNHVNEVLKHDPEVKSRIPIASEQIFNGVQDGIILCKLINAAVPGKIPPISPEAINMSPSTMYHKLQNLNLAIESARSIGCIVVNIRPEFIIEKREHIVLGLIWQIIRIHIANQITIKRHPEIIVLKKEDESDQIMQKLGYEEILLRWLNYHIKRNNGERVIKNFGKDLSDSYAYGNVLKNISQYFKQDFWGKSDDKKAEDVISICNQQKIKTLTTAKDIVSANPRLNTILCAAIFNEKHGLIIKEEIKPVEIVEAQTDETRQMKVFKNWINSQGLDGVYVNYLIDDLRNGFILLKVIERLRPNSVDWKNHYSDKLHSRIHIVQNCNYVLELSKEKLNVKIIQIGGVDIVDGKVTLVLGLVWQMCKVYWEERVGTLSDQKLIEWGNSRVSQQLRIKTFKDKSLSSCRYFLAILDSIQPKCVDYSKLKQGGSQQQRAATINYTISVARKLGAQVMMLWEHVKQTNSRYIYTFMAQLHYISSKHKSY